MQHLQRGLLDVRHQLCALLRVAELRLGLAREVGILHADRDRADDTLAHVVAIDLLLRVVLVERLGEAFLERRQVRTALCRVLPVHKGVVFLREAVGVREDEFQRLGAIVERLVQFFELRLVGDEVAEAVLRDDLLAVQLQRESRVEVGIHLEPAHDMLFAELELLEDRRVRQEAHVGSRTLVRVLELAALL